MMTRRNDVIEVSVPTDENITTEKNLENRNFQIEIAKMLQGIKNGNDSSRSGKREIKAIITIRFLKISL